MDDFWSIQNLYTLLLLCSVVLAFVVAGALAENWDKLRAFTRRLVRICRRQRNPIPTRRNAAAVSCIPLRHFEL